MSRIRTSLCTIQLDPKNGSLTSVKWKKPALELIAEPRLGENFRLLLPEPGLEANYFESRAQRVRRIEAIDDGVTLVYDKLRNERGTVDVRVRYTIRVVDGQLEFTIEVDNRTPLKLAEVF